MGGNGIGFGWERETEKGLEGRRRDKDGRRRDIEGRERNKENRVRDKGQGKGKRG